MLSAKQIEAAREAFYAAGWGQNEVMWKCWQQGMAFAIQSHMDALAKRGLVLVPKEPTEEMICAGFYVLNSDNEAKATWRAMLAAATEGDSSADRD